ncbi:hypothetical protein CEP52_017008 [Fusarium oligoseptatum]|uniref:Uncharacterized protein n=1 Tax=Fusarium oligoseptatum TaxID=2604345 RepID=A0A428RXP1_9HYPO|nr:hypothetical protein CEP52_017008 [Fusarium oligoseptatum]
MKEAVNTATIAKENSEAAVNELRLQVSNLETIWTGMQGLYHSAFLTEDEMASWEAKLTAAKKEYGHAVLDDDKKQRTWSGFLENTKRSWTGSDRHTLAKLAVLLDSGLTGLGKLFDTCPEIVDKAKDMMAKRMDNE